MRLRYILFACTGLARFLRLVRCVASHQRRDFINQRQFRLWNLAVLDQIRETIKSCYLLGPYVCRFKSRGLENERNVSRPWVGDDVPERSNTEMPATTVVKYIISLDE